MIKVGLTGGIGSGKSLACEIFASFGIPVIDADKISHELTAPGGACFDAIRDAFGESVIAPSGTLRRDRLRRIAFTDDEQRKRLEAILHLAVKERIARTLDELKQKSQAYYCIISVPLLVESDMQNAVDVTVVLDCPRDVQIERVVERSGWTPAETLAIIEKQASREQRLAAADIVIDNSADKSALRKQLASLHKTFMNQAEAGRT